MALFLISIQETKMRNIKKVMTASLIAGSLALTGASASAKQFGQFLTGSSGGVYDIVGSSMVNVINKNVPEVRLNPSNPPSYSQTPPTVNSGAAMFGLSDADQFYKAYNGIDEFKTPLQNISIVMPIYSNIMSQITLDKSGIKTMKDAKGKRIAVPSVTTKNMVAQMYEYAGVPSDDINWVYLTYAESASALKDGNVDIATFTAYPKSGTVEGIASLEKMRFIELDQDTIEKWNKANPRARVGIIPAGTYPGVDEDGKFYALYSLLITNDKVDPTIIEKVVDALYANSSEVAASHPAGAQINKDNLPKYIKEGIINSTYVNEGTAKYYKSIGNPLPGSK